MKRSHAQQHGQHHGRDVGPVRDDLRSASPTTAVVYEPRLRRRDLVDLPLWSVFQPNAPGRGELRGSGALKARQLLKGQGWYLAERVLIAVGPDEIVVSRMFAGSPVGPTRRWARHDLLAFPVEPAVNGDATWPAFVLVDLTRAVVVAELRAVRHDEGSSMVVGALEADAC